MKQLVGIWLIWCFPILVWGQYRPDKVSSRAQKWYAEAQMKMQFPTDEAQEEALSLLQKAVEKAPRYLDAYALMGSIYTKNRAYDKAVQNFDAAYKIDSNFLLPAYYTYAKAEAGLGNFSQALRLMNRYLDKSRLSEAGRENALGWKAHFEFGLKSKEKKRPFSPVNLGDSINTTDAEYFPNLTIDKKTLIFTRNINGRHENFYVSHALPDSQWTRAVPLNSPVFGKSGSDSRSRYNMGAVTISQDGKVLMFTICDRPDGLGSCDIYFSVKGTGGWSPPRNVGPPVNSRYWDSQPCLSPDKKELYFVSNRPGGLGGSDIYVTRLQPDGRWGAPQNLGATVNTPGDESSPFIHADNKTLYFASDGRPGVGGVDLYYVRKKVDGSWEKPHNLGYPINTIDHDGSIFVTPDGKTAYFASDRKDSRGRLDLYRFKLYPAARPVMTLYVHGKVFDRKTKQPVTARLELTDLSSGKLLTTVTTDEKGNYLVTLPTGKDYAFNVTRPGYLFYSENFSLKKTNVKWQPYQINIGLQPIEAHARVILKNIFFDFDQYVLQPESYAELDKVVELMKKNPSLSIQINGYTDSVGSAAHNLELSQQRARSVVNYLESKGIPAGRLSAKGYGAAHPVASNETEEGRAKNRRTELEVVSE